MSSITNTTRTLSHTPELIAQRLRQAILRGDLQSNQPLRQDKLAEELGVSKIPVREALAQLKAEGLVTYKSNRGAFVTTLSAAEASEIYLMRMALEELALAQALPKMVTIDLVMARNALTLLDHEDDPARWIALNWEFHAALYQPAGMPHLMATLQQLHINVGRYQVLYLDTIAAYAQSQREHHALLAACEEQNATSAQQILRAHLHNASEALANHLQKEQVTSNDTI